jgi:hypothetical protein
MLVQIIQKHWLAAAAAELLTSVDATIAQQLSSPPPVRAARASSFDERGVLQMLQDCCIVDEPQQQEQEQPQLDDSLPKALCVPATHMRLTNIHGNALLIPSAKAGSTPEYLTNIQGRTFGEMDIQALVVGPTDLFKIEIQLFDGLGQPVVTGT